VPFSSCDAKKYQTERRRNWRGWKRKIRCAEERFRVKTESEAEEEKFRRKIEIGSLGIGRAVLI